MSDSAEYDRGAAQEEKRVDHELVFRTGLEIARERGYWSGGQA